MTTGAATESVLDLLRSVVAHLGLDLRAPLTLDADIRHDLGVDSVDLLDILFEVSERSGAAVTLEQLLERPDPTRVRSVVACVAAAIAGRVGSEEEGG